MVLWPVRQAVDEYVVGYSLQFNSLQYVHVAMYSIVCHPTTLWFGAVAFL